MNVGTSICTQSRQSTARRRMAAGLDPALSVWLSVLLASLLNSSSKNNLAEKTGSFLSREGSGRHGSRDWPSSLCAGRTSPQGQALPLPSIHPSIHPCVHPSVHLSARSPSLPAGTLPTQFAELCRCPVWGLEQEAVATSSFPHPVYPALLSGAMRVTTSDRYPGPECQDLLSSLCLGSSARWKQQVCLAATHGTAGHVCDLRPECCPSLHTGLCVQGVSRRPDLSGLRGATGPCILPTHGSPGRTGGCS